MPSMTEMLAMAKRGQLLRIVEGAEDWLSVLQTFPGECAVGIPGIAALKHIKVAKGLKVVIGRDGDEPGSSADAALIAGQDSLWLQDADVYVTEPAPGEDNNSILMRDGEAGLHQLFDNAVAIKPSKDAEIDRASRWSMVEYESKRRDLADKLGMRVGILDTLVTAARIRRAQQQQSQASGSTSSHWVGVIDPDAAANALLALFCKHQRADNHKLIIVTVWVAHAHLTCAENVNMPRTVRLHFSSGLPGSGKTTMHRMLRLVCPNAQSMSSTTASATFRMLGGPDLPTLLVDEADIQLGSAENELLAVLNCGDTRDTAVIRRSVKNADGNYESQEFPAFCPAVLLGLFDLPPTLEDRSIRLVFRRVLSGNRPERLKKQSQEELADIQRHLRAWTATEPEWEEPDSELDWLAKQTARIADNWTIMFRTAERLGGSWPERLKAAALAEIGTERQLHPSERLLADIFHAMNTLRKPDDTLVPSQWPADCYHRIRSKTLIEKLLDDPYSEWHRCNHGGRIDYAYLRGRLHALLAPNGHAKRWRAGAETCRGYERSQFEGIWAECGITDEPTDTLSSTYTPQKPDTADTEDSAVLRPVEMADFSCVGSYQTPSTDPTQSAADPTQSADPAAACVGSPDSCVGSKSASGTGSAQQRSANTKGFSTPDIAVSGVSGFQGVHADQKGIGQVDGEDPEPLDAEAVIAALIRRHPGLSDNSIAKKAFRSASQVKAVRAALKDQDQAPPPEPEA
jgi:hypothetical protein